MAVKNNTILGRLVNKGAELEDKAVTATKTASYYRSQIESSEALALLSRSQAKAVGEAWKILSNAGVNF